MELGLYFFFGAAFYFLPSWIGTGKRNSTSIFLLNLLLGWTIIGWVVALVWATTKDVSQSANPSLVLPLSPEILPNKLNLPLDPDARANRLKDLRDRGVITQAEFMEQIGQL